MRANSFFLSLKYTLYDSSDVISLLMLPDKRLATCSGEGAIKIYNSTTFKEEIVIEKAHDGKCIHYLSSLNTTTLLSCGEDLNIKIWNIKQDILELIATLSKHKNIVFQVIPLSFNRFASCSNDNTIIIWNAQPPYDKINIFDLRNGWVYSILELKDKNILVSGSDDKYLQFWDLEKYDLIKCIDNIDCCDTHALYEMDNNTLLVGGRNVITIINTKNYTIINSISNKKFYEISSFVKLDENVFICGCGDQVAKGNFFIINMKNPKNIQSFESVHYSFVNHLIEKENNELISCGSDKKVKVWVYSKKYKGEV